MKVESLNQIKILNDKSHLKNRPIEKQNLKKDCFKFERPINITILAKNNLVKEQNKIYKDEID